MGYESLFAPCDLAMLYDWLEETGELYLDLDRPHSGGSNNSLHFVRSLAELRVIVSNQAWPEIDISIFRAKQYPVRGFADDKLLATAVEQIPDSQYFTILSVGADPLAPCSAIGWGSCHRELREELARLEGRQVWVGQDPFDLPPNDHFDRFFNSPDRVLVVRFYTHPEPRVSKNRTAYAPFDAAPDRYHAHIDSWRSPISPQ
jgi:hypothetical protein